MKVKQQANKSSSAMGQLLAKHKDSFVPLNKGEIVKGTIIKLTNSEILIDIGAKTSALVMEKEKSILHTFLANFKEGQEVEALVLTPESETGQPIVTLRRYLGSIAWKKLDELVESHEPVTVTVSEMTKAGYVVTTSFGVSGFLPQSHISFSGNQAVTTGDSLKVTVHELNRKENKIIFSQKPVFSDEEFAKLAAQFKPEQKLEVTIVNITSFGLFVSFPVKDSPIPLEGFIHISEVSWDKTAELQHLFNVGQKIEAIIIKFDKDSKKAQLSIKRLTKDPFEEIMSKYPVDKKAGGSVVKVEETGVEIDLGDGMTGYMRAEKIPPNVSFKEGQEISVLVSEYDKRRKRVYVVPVMLKKQIGYR